jgi:hypothetical protein
MNQLSKTFYDREYGRERYAVTTDPKEHPFYPILSEFIERFQLENKPCLEIGCGARRFPG